MFRFSVRKEIGKNLVKEYNIASLAIMNPFYGQRKPEKQERDAIFHVYTLIFMICYFYIDNY